MKHPLYTILFILSGICLNADPDLSVGDTFPAFTVMDQHENEYTLKPGVHYVLVSFDMSSGKAANQFLEKRGSRYLEDNRAVYLSNIHGMPWIGRKFALPKMRKYPHRILLADEPQKALLQSFPKKDGQLTVFHIDEDLQILTVEFWDPESKAVPIK